MLALRIPMPSDVAAQCYRNSHYGFIQNGKASFPSTNCLWMGNDDVGLCWFTESFAGWNLSDTEQGVRLDRSQDKTVVDIRIIDTPTEIKEPLKLIFGLLATPSNRWTKAGRDATSSRQSLAVRQVQIADSERSKDLYVQLFTQDVFFDPVLILNRASEKEGEIPDQAPQFRASGGNIIAWSQFTSVGRNEPPDYRYYGRNGRSTLPELTGKVQEALSCMYACQWLG